MYNSVINNSHPPTQHPAPGGGVAPLSTPLTPPPGPKTGQSQGRVLSRGRGWVVVGASTMSNGKLTESKLTKSKLNYYQWNKGIWIISQWSITNRLIQKWPIDMKLISGRCIERIQAQDYQYVVDCTWKFDKKDKW